ncbi:MAG TPA: peptidoglycan-binding protein, partial [Candidatus Nitrosotenuis sp.]|nr:peptidoglycan-binding protein [Candidatus Nitrosotenuis sp.]
MTVVKRITDLTNYTTVLPYASELFGVYQPLIGWKSKRIADRFNKGFQKDRPLILDKLKNEFAGLVDISYREGGRPDIKLKAGALDAGKFHSFDSIVLQQISLQLPPYEEYKPSIWPRLITAEMLDSILNKEVVKHYSTAYVDLQKTNRLATTLDDRNPNLLMRTAPMADDQSKKITKGVFEHQLQYESAMAGALLFLVKEKSHDALAEIFYTTKNNTEKATQLIKMLAAKETGEAYLDFEHLNPQDKDFLKSVALSPISVVHLFRQYFFELDTFLGTPVSHVWLSPGSSVELIEIHTRKTTVEKTIETTLDILTASEKTTTNQDEISDAVKEQNQQDVNFGASVKASYASIEATSSFDYKNSQQMARETTHKIMRQQTEKLSSEIRKNYKTTFKTITEYTDVSSVKHVLANTTANLINYELRRKMRQVGVQVQDIGTYLCWQTYVDDPGKELGLAKLIHIAKPADLDTIPHPEEIPLLQPFQEDKMVTIP